MSFTRALDARRRPDFMSHIYIYILNNMRYINNRFDRILRECNTVCSILACDVPAAAAGEV